MHIKIIRHNLFFQKIISKFWLWFGHRPSSIYWSVLAIAAYIYLSLNNYVNDTVVSPILILTAFYSLFQLFFAMKWEVDWFFSQVDFIKSNFCDCCSTAKTRNEAFERMKFLAEHLYQTRNWILKDRENPEKFIAMLDRCQRRAMTLGDDEKKYETIAEEIYQILLPIVYLNHRAVLPKFFGSRNKTNAD